MNRQKSFETQQPALYIVATPIGNLQELTPRARAVLEEVDVIAAEDTRNTQKLLAHFGISTHMIAHHKFNEAQSSKGILHLLEEGKSVAIVSDAGYPLISDPGAQLVSEVIDAGYPAVPISGSSAALIAAETSLLLSVISTFITTSLLTFFRELHILTVRKLMFPFFEPNLCPLAGGRLTFYTFLQIANSRQILGL